MYRCGCIHVFLSHTIHTLSLLLSHWKRRPNLCRRLVVGKKAIILKPELYFHNKCASNELSVPVIGKSKILCGFNFHCCIHSNLYTLDFLNWTSCFPVLYTVILLPLCFKNFILITQSDISTFPQTNHQSNMAGGHTLLILIYTRFMPVLKLGLPKYSRASFTSRFLHFFVSFRLA